MIAGQVGAKATRDALFLSIFPATELPKAMLASAVLAIAAMVLMSRGLAYFGPARLVPALFALSGFAFAGEWWLARHAPQTAAWVIYLHVAVVGVTVISGFWSVVNERFDPHTAKRVVGRIAAGATVGGLLGGVGAERVATYFDAPTMLLVLAALNIMAALSTTRTAINPTGRRPAPPSRTADAGSALTHLSRNPYLQRIGALVGLTALTAGLVDYAFKAQAAAAYADSGSEALMSFFALFYTATSLVAVVLQTGLGGRLLARLGLGGTMAILPGAMVLAGVLGAAVTRLWSMVLLRGTQAALESSLFREAYELLFTPVPPEVKRPTKAVLDVGFDRLGGAIAGGLVMLLLALSPELATRVSVTIAAVVAAGTLWVALWLQRGYVQQLAASLRSGTIQLDERDVVDATTRRTLSETTMAIDREKLLEEIQKLRTEPRVETAKGQVALAATMASGRAEDGRSAWGAADQDGPPAGDGDGRADEIVERIAGLRSGARPRIEQALAGPLDPTLVAHVVPLLERDDLARRALRALGTVAEQRAGQLTDALLDPQQSVEVRRRVARLLGDHPTPRAAAGLLEALEDDHAQVRQRAGAALVELVARRPELAPPRRVVFAIVQREIRKREEPNLDHLFAIMSLCLDADTLTLALQALRSDDETMQGTSLEYLEHVLPEQIAESLWPYLEELSRASLMPPPSRRAGAPRRRQEEIVDDLRRSVAGLVIDPEALRRPPDRD